MPEVIEIRKYADFLKKHLKNKELLEINIKKGRYKNHTPFKLYYSLTKLLPLKIIDIKTKGKFLYFILENNFYIFSTLGLHGGWVFYNNIKKKYKFNTMLEYVDKEKVSNYYKTALNNLNVEFVTKDGSIYYFDSLSFGTLKVINNIDDLNKKLSSIGPDIMDITTTKELFIERYRNPRLVDKPIGIILLNQKIISGVGNYLRSDALWISRISPFRKIKNITDLELIYIYDTLKALTWGDYNMKKGILLNYITNKSLLQTVSLMTKALPLVLPNAIAFASRDELRSSVLPNNFNRDFFVYNSIKDIYNNSIIKEELYEGSIKRFIYWVKKIQK